MPTLNPVLIPQPELQHQWTFYEDNLQAITDPGLNTHLWIVTQAVELLHQQSVISGSNIQYKNNATAIAKFVDAFRTNATFHNNICQGIWDADMKDPFNGPHLIIDFAELTPPFNVPYKLDQALYPAHFYDPLTRKNWQGDLDWTAMTESERHFYEAVRHSLNLSDAKAGYFLGLALHFFTDVTQPMHSNNYINLYNWKDTILSYGGFGFKHKNFEEFANTLMPGLNAQSSFDWTLIDRNSADYLQMAAESSKPHCEFIHMVMVPNNADWKTQLTTTIYQLLNTAVSFTAQYLLCWAQRAYYGKKDDKVLVRGALSVMVYEPQGSQREAGYTRIVSTDSAGTLKSKIWDAEHGRGVENWQDLNIDNLSRYSMQPGTLAGMYTDGVLRLLTLSNNGHLFHTFFLGSTDKENFMPWEDLDKPYAQGNELQHMSLVSLRWQHVVDLFCISHEGTLLHKYWSGTNWTDWEVLMNTHLGGGLTGDITIYIDKEKEPVCKEQISSLAVMTGYSPLDVFAISKEGHLLQMCFGQTWQGWQDLGKTDVGGGLRVKPGSLSALRGQSYIDVFAISNSNTLLHRFYYATPGGDAWSSWYDLGGDTSFGGLDGSIVAVRGLHPIDVFTISKNGDLLLKTWDGSDWTTGWNKV